MSIPSHTYHPGTNVGMIVRYQGTFIDKTFGYRDENDEYRRGTVRVYNQPVWYWTGYRWVAYNEVTNGKDARQDSLRAKAGRKVVKNEWV